MADRRIVEEEFEPQDRGRSRGPIIALLVIAAVVLLGLVLMLVSGDSDDDGDGVDPADIEVDIGEDG